MMNKRFSLKAVALKDYIDDSGVFICTQGQSVIIKPFDNACIVKTNCGWYEADIEDFKITERIDEVSGVYRKRT